MTLSWPNIREARAFGLSDIQERDELRVQRRLTAAITESRAAIEDVNSSSILLEIEPSAFDNVVSDELSSDQYWAEELREAH